MARRNALQNGQAQSHTHRAYLLYRRQQVPPLLADERQHREDRAGGEELKTKSEHINGQDHGGPVVVGDHSVGTARRRERRGKV